MPSVQLPHSRFRPVEHVIATRHGGTTVLLDADRGTYYTLNEVGGSVWLLLTASEPVDSIVEQLRREYDMPVERLAADIESLVDRLLVAKLIEPGQP